MKKPTIHKNGTYAGDLLKDYTAAIDAIREAIKAMRRACPNARDYYPLGSGAFPVAVAEHEARIEKLTSVLQEMTELAMGVAPHVK